MKPDADIDPLWPSDTIWQQTLAQLMAWCLTIVDLSSNVLCGIHLLMKFIHNMYLEIILLKLLSYLPGAKV